ncbi:hypothetical protein OV203_13230 [Nannocystis sp. ILAH1]|uniref:hypothetical protein n=1 Tax=Nannocystis sp. ILAH1 TaxID=2996789 RepID=UPI002270031A|nr:hypothetical protein [Nannocystis sp. ILAH1]MCY0988094.1 hypothetical protein [Nannocystis sp. ILAH1]
MSAEELPEELRQAGDSPLDLALMVDRGLRWWHRLCAEPRLRALTLRCDLGGNEEEFAALAEAIAAVGLPPRLQRLVLDRRRHWSDRWEDVLELDEASESLGLEIDDPGDAAPILAALQVMLKRAPELRRIALASNARGRNDLDPALELVVAAGPWPQLRSLALTCDRSHERDWVQWVATRTIARVLAQCPGLTMLSLPRAELWLDALEHATLRELEIGWLGSTPLGPSDRRDWGPGPTPRGSGIEFLREARLPALERLAIDFQYDWYVGWQSADFEALCAARGLPRLRHVELRYCLQGDELLRGLPDAPWAGGLERLELPGTEFDEATVAALVAAKPRLGRLSELWCFRPYQLADEAWQSLCATYQVHKPA